MQFAGQLGCKCKPAHRSRGVMGRNVLKANDGRLQSLRGDRLGVAIVIAVRVEVA